MIHKAISGIDCALTLKCRKLVLMMHPTQTVCDRRYPGNDPFTFGGRKVKGTILQLETLSVRVILSSLLLNFSFSKAFPSCYNTIIIKGKTR